MAINDSRQAESLVVSLQGETLARPGAWQHTIATYQDTAVTPVERAQAGFGGETGFLENRKPHGLVAF